MVVLARTEFGMNYVCKKNIHASAISKSLGINIAGHNYWDIFSITFT